MSYIISACVPTAFDPMPPHLAGAKGEGATLKLERTEEKWRTHHFQGDAVPSLQTGDKLHILLDLQVSQHAPVAYAQEVRGVFVGHM